TGFCIFAVTLLGNPGSEVFELLIDKGYLYVQYGIHLGIQFSIYQHVACNIHIIVEMGQIQSLKN
ncbi:hypothetical protein ACJX0J_007722, partial [Zea mays]